MESLETFFAGAGNRDIFALGRYIQQYVEENWEPVFQQNRQEMIDSYDTLGDAVYGMYGTRLFKPVHQQLKLSGLKAVPRLPGNLNISREWGDDESDRQRWFWSKIVRADGTAFGTIVTVFYHNHIEISIPRVFRIIALTETSNKDVVKALSKLSPDFANALEMQIEYAEYMKQQE